MVQPKLVRPRLGDVPHPRQRLVPALLNHLQEPHLHSRHREVRHLELDHHRRLLLPRAVVLQSAHAGQRKLCPHLDNLLTRHALDLPQHRLLLRRVRHAPERSLHLRRRRVPRHRELHLHARRVEPGFELRSELDAVFNPRPRRPRHLRLHPYQRLDRRGDPVVHQVELAVGRDERDGPVALEPRQPHALVKLDILELHALTPRALVLRLEHNLIVQPELALGHPAQLRAHPQRSVHLGVHHRPVRVDHTDAALDHIQENLVFLVPESLRSPRHRVGDRHRSLWRVQLVRADGDELAQDLSLGELRVPVVHDLVQELVDDHEVVSNGLLLELFEVVREDVHESVEECHERHRVGVRARQGQEVEVAVLYVHEGRLDVCVVDYRLEVRLGLGVVHDGDEPLHHGRVGVAAPVPHEQCLEIAVQNVQRGAHRGVLGLSERRHPRLVSLNPSALIIARPKDDDHRVNPEVPAVMPVPSSRRRRPVSY